MLNEVSIKCFLTLAKTLNFTKTAKMLHMTQQAVSKHISKLEDDLGFILFFRSYHAITLTTAGENFYQLFSQMDNDFRSAVEKTRSYYDTLANSISLGYIYNLDISDCLNKAIKSYKDTHQDIVFMGEQHFTLELNDRLLNNKLDLIITHEIFVENLPEINYCVILEGPMMLVFSADSNLASGAGISLHSFQNETFLFGDLGSKDIMETTNRIQKTCAECGFSPEKIIILPNLASLEAAVEMGQGVSFCSAFNKILKNPLIRSYTLNKKAHVVCAWAEKTENQAVPFFVKHLKDHFKAFETQLFNR